MIPGVVNQTSTGSSAEGIERYTMYEMWDTSALR